MYTAVWGGTLSTLQKVNGHILDAASCSITALLNTLPPTSLAAMTKAILEAGNERRKKQDRQPDVAAEILIELFKAGPHRYIRLATLEGLLSVLVGLCNEKWRSNALVEKIIVALETVIPIVGIIDERRAPRPEDWEEARKSGTLPDVSDVSAGLPPLLSAVLAGPGGKCAGLQHLRADFVDRFFLPILEYSKSEHRKWVAMFLDKYKPSFTIEDLSATPLTPLLWDTLLKDWSDFLPRSVLKEMNKYTVLTIAPLTNLKDFNDSLKNNIELRNKPDVQHWLLIFDQRMTWYPRSTTHKLLNMIQHTQPHPLINNGISYDRISTTILQHAFLFLDDYENYTEIWDNFVQDLWHSKNRYTAGINFREDADGMAENRQTLT